MDVVNSLTDKPQAAALLALPQSDMLNKVQNQNHRNVIASRPSQLVLMQLPASLSMDVFQKAGNCRFLASTASSSSLMSSQSCCLVVESQGATFDLVKVETSNALILIPPSQQAAGDCEPQHKKTKIDDVNNNINENSKHNRATELTSIPCRLLQVGGSGASFLELRAKTLCLKSLVSLLQQHLFDPYSQNDTSAWRGRTVESLVFELLLSQDQIIEGLVRLNALALVNGGNSSQCVSYGILSEEALQEGQCALLSALAECREFEQYATAEIPYESLIQESMKRTSETYPYLDQVLRHCVQTTLLLTNEPCSATLLRASKLHPMESRHVRLDIRKVATCVAKQLFLKQTEPWEEEPLLSRWQSELPGVGEDYQVSLDLLRGVAICKSKKWKYFANHQLPLEPEERFHALFHEQEMWSLDELDPYLEPLTGATNLSTTELLHRYTKVVHKETQPGEADQAYYTRIL